MKRPVKQCILSDLNGSIRKGSVTDSRQSERGHSNRVPFLLLTLTVKRSKE